MKEMLIGEAIVKSFGEGDERRNVLDGVSIAIEPGEFVAIMGPSGSGKSTLLYALSGMDTIDSGKVCFDGMELPGLSEDALADLRRTRMGFVFQQPTLLKNLNILDNILLPSLRDRRASAAKLREKALGLMRKAGIAELAHRDVTQASGGQLQRAGICRALMSDPKILFGDEPTGALNSKVAQEIMDLFAEINAGGTAVMLVTHDPQVAARAERVLFMHDGRIADEMRQQKYDASQAADRVRRVAERMQEIGI